MKAEHAICLNYDEQKFLYEYVTLDTHKIDHRTLNNSYKSKRCGKPFHEITVIEQFQNTKLFKNQSIYDTMDGLENIFLYTVLREHNTHFEFIQLGTEIDTLQIKSENFEDFVSILWFTKEQMIQMKEWTQIEEVKKDQINELKKYYERNLETIEIQINREVPYSSHPYRTPEMLQIAAKALLLHRINPMATHRRYRKISEQLQ